MRRSYLSSFTSEGIDGITWHQQLYVKRMRKKKDHCRLISDNPYSENKTRAPTILQSVREYFLVCDEGMNLKILVAISLLLASN